MAYGRFALERLAYCLAAAEYAARNGDQNALLMKKLAQCVRHKEAEVLARSLGQDIGLTPRNAFRVAAAINRAVTHLPGQLPRQPLTPPMLLIMPTVRSLMQWLYGQY